MLAARVWSLSLGEEEVGSVCARGRLVQLPRFFKMVFGGCWSLVGVVFLLLSLLLVLFLSLFLVLLLSLFLSLVLSFLPLFL